MLYDTIGKGQKIISPSSHCNAFRLIENYAFVAVTNGEEPKYDGNVNLYLVYKFE